MTLLSQIFDVYIDLNITFAITAVVWMVVKNVLERSGGKLAFNIQLGLLNCLFVVTIVSPVIVLLYLELQASGFVSKAASINLSDYVVSQYLRGGISVPPEDFQSLLGVRARITDEVLSLGTGAGAAIAAFLMLGFGFFGVKLGQSFLELNRALSACHVWRRHGRTWLMLSDNALVPYSARGFFTHYVVIPSELLAQPEDLKLVLKHEFEHIRQGDVAWEIGLETLRPFFFWNPFFYIWKSEVERLRELACDQKVAADAGVDLKSYCMCLLRAAQAGLRKRQLAKGNERSGLSAVALIEVQDRLFRRSPSQKLRRRVDALMERGRVNPHWAIVAFVVVPMAAATILTALSLQKPADWSHDRLMLSAIINLERLETINSFGSRPLDYTPNVQVSQAN